jgi:hypothetical protein
LAIEEEVDEDGESGKEINGLGDCGTGRPPQKAAATVFRNRCASQG